MRPESLDFLKALVNAPSPSGYEQAVANVYRSYTEPFVDRVETDIHGNVTAMLHADAPVRIMLAAHMDEIGFVIHYIDDNGLIYFSPIGGHNADVPVGQRVWIHGRSCVPGVVGSMAFHLLDTAEQSKKVALKDLWIDIGATSRAEVDELVRLGDVITFQHEFQPLLGDRAAARGVDNKAGLFIVAEALRLLHETDGLHPSVGVYGLGTVQEEIGSRGARTAAFDIAPVTGLAIDMDHAIDYPGVSKSRHGELAIGKGPTVSRGANINHKVFDLLTQAAEEEGIDYQVSVFASATPTDANAMQINRGGMATGLVGVPIRYMHTPSETASLADVEQCARLVAAYCRRITPDTDFTPTP
jgi:endoglucanase